MIVPGASVSIGQVLRPAGFENAQGLLSAHYSKDATDPQWKDDPGIKASTNFSPNTRAGRQPARIRRWMSGYNIAETIAVLLSSAVTTSPAPM